MKKQNCFALTAILAFAGTITIMANKNNALKAFGASTSNWKHFEAVEATYETRGIKEYWTDCVGGEPLFNAPTDVEIKEGGVPSTEFINSLELTDSRLIPAFNDYSVLMDDKIILQYESLTGYSIVQADETTDNYFGPVYSYDMSKVLDNKTNNAFFQISPANNSKFSSGAVVYVYVENDLTVNYTNGLTWAGVNFNLKANQWNKVTITGSMVSKTAFDYFYVYSSSVDTLSTLGTIKVSKYVGDISFYEDITVNFNVAYDHPSWTALNKTEGLDDNIGAYNQIDLTSVPEENSNVAIFFNTLVDKMKNRETFFYVYFESEKDFNAQVAVQNPADDWSGPSINYVANQWNKVTLDAEFVKKLNSTNGVYFFFKNILDGGKISDLGTLKISHIYSVK